MNASKFLLLIAAFTGFACTPFSPALAQMQKVGRVIIGVPAGANFDATARVLADRMSKLGGQQFIVENRPGAGQTIAAEFVARAPADGLTLFLSPINPMVTEPQINRQNVRYDPFKDFAPISIIATQDVALATGPALPVASLGEYIAAIRADSTKGYYTSPGANSLPHFFGLLIGRRTGASMTHVPYQGPAPAIQAVLGGQVPGMIVGYADLVAFHRAGKVRMLALSGDARNPLTPEVPTFVELGIPIRLSVWYGVWAPAATSRELIDRTNRLIVESARSREMANYLIQSGHRVVGSTPQELADALKRDYDYWGTVIRESGIVLQ